MLSTFLAFTSFAASASAPVQNPTRIDLPDAFDGIRCNSREKKGDLYIDVNRGSLGSMYWITHDQVRLLSTQLTAQGNVITGRVMGSGESYVFDYDRSELTKLDRMGQVLEHYSDMDCRPCATSELSCLHAAADDVGR